MNLTEATVSMLNTIHLENGNFFGLNFPCLKGKFYKRGIHPAVAQSRVTNLRDLCGILAASASRDLGHAKFLAFLAGN